jgi:hypothetical protein
LNNNDLIITTPNNITLESDILLDIKEYDNLKAIDMFFLIEDLSSLMKNSIEINNKNYDLFKTFISSFESSQCYVKEMIKKLDREYKKKILGNRHIFTLSNFFVKNFNCANFIPENFIKLNIAILNKKQEKKSFSSPKYQRKNGSLFSSPKSQRKNDSLFSGLESQRKNDSLFSGLEYQRKKKGSLLFNVNSP